LATTVEAPGEIRVEPRHRTGGRRAGRRARLAGIASLAATAALALDAAPALAAVSASGFSIGESTTQAGAAPTLAIDAPFTYSDGTDTVKSVSLTWASGFLADPAAVTALCTSAELQSNTCPAASQIGTASMTANTFVGGLGEAFKVYLMPPAGAADYMEIGIVSTDGSIAESAPVTIVEVAGNVAMSLSLTLPNSVSVSGIPVAIQVTDLAVTIDGTVDGHAFTRNPTGCTNGTSTLTVNSYESATNVVVKKPYTVTCARPLGYAPTLAEAIKRDAADTGVAVTVTTTNAASDSATRSARFSLPPSLVERAATLAAARAAACKPTALTSCPQVGTLTATIPYTPTAIPGKVYLVGTGPTTPPNLDVVFPDPFALRTVATTTSGVTGTTASFAVLPDAPFTKAVASFSGGVKSLFTQGTGLCSAPGNMTAAMKAYNGDGKTLTVKPTCS
jgi:hypothetical protein